MPNMEIDLHPENWMKQRKLLWLHIWEWARKVHFPTQEGKILICKTSLDPSGSVRNEKIRSKHEITQKIDVYRKQAVPMVARSGDRREKNAVLLWLAVSKFKLSESRHNIQLAQNIALASLSPWAYKIKINK